jgi:glucosamine kinase
MNKKVILGLDGGGTYTRIAITDTEGNLLSYVESKGASSIYKDIKASENVHNAINEAVGKADCSLGDIISLAAGVAGLDHESDLEWARELTRIDGLNCLSRHVNDAVTAHSGAFFSKPGIIAISGTGSNIFGITENGRHISNYNFHHYAATAARFLSYDTVYKIIAGETNQTDDDLVDQVLTYFEAADLSALSKQGSEGFTADKRARDKQFGNLAPVITNAALNGSDLAIEICNRAAAAIATGIRLVGSSFDSDIVQVALIGSVVNSTYIKNALNKILGKKTHKEYSVASPALPAVLGAVIMAFELKGISLSEQILNNLSKGAQITSHATL